MNTQRSIEIMATKFEDVLQEEKEKIGKKEKLIGLAFSGGGIRSATFNLGIIQALAQKKLLNKFDYLSTVSGGSYIGSWLTSWAYREQQNTQKNIEQRTGIEQVQDKLNDKTDPTQNKAEPREISWLRQYSNYLTPRKGLFSFDTLTDLTYHFRNVFLSSVVIGLFAFGIMSLFVALMPVNNNDFTASILLFIGSIIGLTATARIWSRLPLVSGELVTDKKNSSFTPDINKKEIFFIAFGIVFFTIALGIFGAQFNPVLVCFNLGIGYCIATVMGISHAHHIKNYKRLLINVNWRWLYATALLGSIPFFALGGLFLFSLWNNPVWNWSELYSPYFFDSSKKEWKGPSLWELSGIGVPFMCLLLSFIVTIHLGIVGRAIPSEAYFWISRVAAKMAQYSLVFALPAAIFLFSPPLLDWTEATLAVGSIFAAFAIVVRWLATSTATGSNKNKQVDWREKFIEGMVSIAPFILVFALLGFVSLGVRTAFENDPTRSSHLFDEKLEKYQFTCHENITPVKKLLNPQQDSDVITFESIRDGLQGYHYYEIVNCAPSLKDYLKLNILALNSITWFAPCVWGFIAIVIAWFLGKLINANLFSMHTFYRNRLTNAYLASSNRIDSEKREISRDPDIGVHSTDAIDLKKLADIKPYLIVNTTLNLVGENNDLAWQDRKATSFIMSPLYCGYVLDGTKDHSKEYFQKTKSYARKNRAAYRQKNENSPNEYFLKLDLAMTISGAASSPLSGFHTKPGVSMLMALGGARLGWWLSNPAKEEWWRGQGKRWQFSSDTPLLTTLYKEISSEANEEGEKIYLSDGGHFENLGIYELVRRRCALIVASDAGEDHLFNFDDLANAIHKIRVDFGVEIEIDVSELRPDKIPGDDGAEEFSAKNRFSSKNFVIGKVKYASSAKTEFKNEKDGVLIYIKSSLPVSAKSRAIDVLNYAALHNQFPHESTFDQWFSEDQFEAYRQIGYLIGEDAAQLIHAKLIEMT
jgi:hypothetical protein